MYHHVKSNNSLNLQATISAGSSGTYPDQQNLIPHHPIACNGELRFEEDGTFACEHVGVPPGDLRTEYCLQQSMAILLIELAHLL